ncbi:MAG: hypothetical protein AAGJ37_06245 [Pseudomonadota bacterium]
MNFKNSKTKTSALFFSFVLLLVTGCNTTSRSLNQPILVGPTEPEVKAAALDKYVANLQQSTHFLDVAVPTFDPGFPMTKDGKEIDYSELDEEGIWPQLRRTEAKLFAVETKNALEKSAAFSSVRVVPNANTSADIFVLGRVLESTSEEVGFELTVVTAAGEVLGKKDFEHKVDENFFKDQRNAGKNPYQPVYDKGRDYVLSLLSQLSDAEKKEIKDIATIRYARYYSPEAYSQYISTEVKRKAGQSYYEFSLNGIPADDDMNFKRIKDLQAQEMLFVDRLQDNYDTFYAETNDAYRTWQEETLPEIIAYREAKFDRNVKAGLGIGLAVLAGILASNEGNSGSSLGRGATTAGAVLAGVGSAITINEAFKSNSELKVQSAIIEEKGQAVDLSVSPTEMKFEDQIVELNGTASEQYLQWKQHLREMYEIEKTPDVQL